VPCDRSRGRGSAERDREWRGGERGGEWRGGGLVRSSGFRREEFNGGDTVAAVLGPGIGLRGPGIGLPNKTQTLDKTMMLNTKSRLMDNRKEEGKRMRR